MAAVIISSTESAVVCLVKSAVRTAMSLGYHPPMYVRGCAQQSGVHICDHDNPGDNHDDPGDNHDNMCGNHDNSGNYHRCNSSGILRQARSYTCVSSNAAAPASSITLACAGLHKIVVDGFGLSAASFSMVVSASIPARIILSAVIEVVSAGEASALEIEVVDEYGNLSPLNSTVSLVIEGTHACFGTNSKQTSSTEIALPFSDRVVSIRVFETGHHVIRANAPGLQPGVVGLDVLSERVLSATEIVAVFAHGAVSDPSNLDGSTNQTASEASKPSIVRPVLGKLDLFELML